MLNDSYRTPLHMLHPPHTIALGCLYLTSVLRQLDLRGWLEGLNTDLNQVTRDMHIQGGVLFMFV